jgi:hypothetical protein
MHYITAQPYFAGIHKDFAPAKILESNILKTRDSIW